MSGSILRKRMNRGLRKNAAVVAFFLFSALLVLAGAFLLSGSTAAEVLPAVQVLSDPREQYLPLLLDERENSVLLVCSGEEDTLLLRLDGSTGQVLLQREIPSLSVWSALRGDYFFILEYTEDGTFLTAYDTDTLAERSRASLPVHPDRLLQFDCDAAGTVTYTLAGSPAVLRTFSAAGEESREFSGPVEYLETAGDGSLLVFADKKLFYARQGEAFQEVPCLAPPCKRLSETILIDRDGIVSALKTDETGVFLSSRFRCSEQLTDAFSFCLDGENCLLLSNGSTVFRYDMKGENQGSCHLASVPLAICPAGAILREGDALSYSVFSFPGTDRSPDSTDSSLGSDPPPQGPASAEPPIEVEDQYILMPAGSTVAELRELFKPEAVKICDVTGKQITQGKLATGMTAGDWFIVIEGDCNGTGTVNSADLRTALSLFLDSDIVTDANTRAVDLNDNGVIDTEDLFLLSAMVGE